MCPGQTQIPEWSFSVLRRKSKQSCSLIDELTCHCSLAPLAPERHLELVRQPHFSEITKICHRKFKQLLLSERDSWAGDGTFHWCRCSRLPVPALCVAGSPNGAYGIGAGCGHIPTCIRKARVLGLVMDGQVILEHQHKDCWCKTNLYEFILELVLCITWLTWFWSSTRSPEDCFPLSLIHSRKP